ncbi:MULTISPECIES: M1 family aminopeptidase [unclassified Lentimicrobium]|uniref:M1 family aminopeptidase n=1 Tax=unclassified Lentimicrobium TaxID=2677434 RepID=UPI001555CEA4|nr:MULTISPECIES: M1 family aminopeptidase [unclassified Lentimicrobium]NPD46923.1 T9SS type A sorting domain-containing protein [Lentimicrobium sp. S6]NPD84127.1 T9SS type A sorting domain-containing protein [Lentimicrobium sp. L6]
MKKIFFLSFLVLNIIASAQLQRHNPHGFETPIKDVNTDWYPVEDPNYDVLFYHIDVEIAVDSIYISGEVKFLISSNIDNLNSLMVDLDQTFDVESISFPVSNYTFEDNVLYLQLENTYQTGDTLSFRIQYSGHPEMPGGYKGLRYETHDGNQPIIASLSTPYLAHSWWPCKDGTSDKCDSLYMDITVKDTIIDDLQLIALSNGLLVDEYTDGVMRTFKWQHKYPIIPYYIMVAISNYEHFQQDFEMDDMSFPLDYYVFESHLANAQNGVSEMPDAMAFFSEIFGPYPFSDEKYGMTQLGYYGAIENQTNTITNNMSQDWLDVSVHELAHQWFADYITCENWHHGWVNEGFASYAEALYFEHRDGFEAYQSYVIDFEFYNSGTLYIDDISDPFSGVFRPIIYNKGAYVLHMLRGVLGDEMFFNVIYEYATNDNFKYGWANTEDFQSVCEEVSGEDLDYFFEQWIYDERYPKYRYNYLSSTNLTEVIIQQSQGLLGWREIFTMPLEIYFQFEDGSDTIVSVFNDEIEQHFAFNFEQEVIDMEIDPGSWVLCTKVFDSNIIVGNQEFEELVFRVFPNPSEGSFTIQLDGSFRGKKVSLVIFDLNGSEVQNQEVNSASISVQGLKKGIYLLKISSSNINHSKKLIVY